MQTGRIIVFFSFLTLSLSVSIFRRQRTSVLSSARRGNNSSARKVSRTAAGGAAASNQTEHVTKVQVEDLDEATTAECIRLRELDFCDDGAGTARYPPNAVGHSSESEARTSMELFPSFLDSPSCRLLLRPFLCVALTATCSLSGDETPAALPPCRTLCSAAADGCKEVLDDGGIDWPAEWSCHQFPVEGLCLDQPIQHGTGLKHGRDGRGELPGHETFAIESQGSLQPPPSSAFDSELLALPDGTAGSSRPAARRLLGDSRFFQGWVDVQGLGQANDYCRVIGSNSRDRILSCAINGTESDRHLYISKRGFDPGRPGSGFMKDVDGDRRDDYCRCVGNNRHWQLICMKAGERGFHGGKMQQGSQYTIKVQTASIFDEYCRRNSNY